MADSQVYWSFGDLAFRWSRKRGVRYSEDDVHQLIVPAFWRGEFDDSDLRWDDGAMITLYGAEEAASAGAIYVHESGFSDYEPLPNGRVRQEIHGMLHTLGDETAIAFDNPTDGSAFDALAKTPWDAFSERSKIVLKHIEVSEPALLRWCEANGLGPPAFVVSSEGGEVTPHRKPSAPAEEARQPLDSVSSTAEKRRAGRPSLDKEILAAYDDLVKTEMIVHPTTKAATYPIIRSRVHELFPDDVEAVDRKGLGNEAIRKAILARFDENQDRVNPPKASP